MSGAVERLGTAMLERKSYELLDNDACAMEGISFNGVEYPWSEVTSIQKAMIGFHGVTSGADGCRGVISEVLLGDYTGASVEKRWEVASTVAFLSLHAHYQPIVTHYARDMARLALDPSWDPSIASGDAEPREVLERGFQLIQELLREDERYGGVSLKRWQRCLDDLRGCIGLYSTGVKGSYEEVDFFNGFSDVFGSIAPGKLAPLALMVKKEVRELLLRCFFSLLEFMGMEGTVITDELRSAPGDHGPIFALSKHYDELWNSMEQLDHLALALPTLTWGDLHRFGSLIEEYNVEWALAAMEWNSGR